MRHVRPEHRPALPRCCRPAPPADRPPHTPPHRPRAPHPQRNPLPRATFRPCSSTPAALHSPLPPHSNVAPTFAGQDAEHPGTNISCRRRNAHRARSPSPRHPARVLHRRGALPPSPASIPRPDSASPPCHATPPDESTPRNSTCRLVLASKRLAGGSVRAQLHSNPAPALGSLKHSWTGVHRFRHALWYKKNAKNVASNTFKARGAGSGFRV
ncbi:hypothetical protein T484DRAFT_1987944 [Baffinella frigidus]|nr:hypothetical protein T484DRAFT_1987944 [Cryptophyta sp. CCMP2293]